MSPATSQGGSGSPTRILVVDDEADMLTNYRRLLGRAGHDCATIQNPGEIESALRAYKPDLVLTDLVMPGGSGLDVLERVSQYDAGIPVILVTGHGSIDNAVAAMKRRAADYLTKPFSVEDLLGKIQQALSHRLIERDTPAHAEREHEAAYWSRKIVGVSPPLMRVQELARKVARTDVNTLIVGESGTGKELFARAIHHSSARNKEIFVPIDCASLPESLLESELFGYCKGAFTGANSNKMGLLEFANGGTLFLDEIGEMPMALQAKFLRVLQERRFRPIGGHDEIAVDIRVVAATNKDLELALQERVFRSDLYYRLNVVTIALPPLRDRQEDIPILADYFLRRFVRDNDRPILGISARALAHLRSCEWPGNVRELQNAIERAATLAAGPLVEVEDLPERLRSHEAQKEQTQAASTFPSAGSGAPGLAYGAQLFPMKDQLVEDFERDYLISLLDEHHFNVSRAAQAAGCHRRTLYRMVRRYNLDLAALRLQANLASARKHKEGASSGSHASG